MLQYSWQGPSEWHGCCAYTLSSEEWVLLKSRMREICKSGSERGVKFFYMAEYCDTLQSKEKRNREYKVCLNDRALRLLDHNVTVKRSVFRLLKDVTFHCSTAFVCSSFPRHSLTFYDLFQASNSSMRLSTFKTNYVGWFGKIYGLPQE